MSSLGDLVTDTGALFGDTGHNSVESLVKNKELQGYLDQSTKDFGATRTASAAALESYIKDFLAGGEAAKTRTGQEIGAVDRYYNGDVERQLSDLRTRRAQASQDALSRALGYATRTANSDRIMSGGGPSSYDTRLALRTGTDLNLQTLLDNLNQERADQEYLRQNQLGLAGRRTGMADALAARGLMPAQARKSELGWNLDTLGNMIKLDQANKFYGVKYNPSLSEGLGNVTGDLGNAAMQAFSIYSGGMGGMGGGGGGGSRSHGPTTTWGTGTYGAGGPGLDQWGTPMGAGYSAGYDYEQPPGGWGGSGYEPSAFSAAPAGGGGFTGAAWDMGF